MGSRLVKQPNGLLARFSDIVDDFTHTNMTHEDAHAMYKERGLTYAEASQKIMNAENDLLPYSNKMGSGLDRWNDCVETIRLVHKREPIL